jgi:NADPH:quinone reductase-like Zn-dependent oxidoreductase
MKQLLQMLGTKVRGSRKVLCVLSPPRTEDPLSLNGLIEAGEIRSIIDRCYPLEQTAQSHWYVEQGHE